MNTPTDWRESCHIIRIHGTNRWRVVSPSGAWWLGHEGRWTAEHPGRSLDDREFDLASQGVRALRAARVRPPDMLRNKMGVLWCRAMGALA